MKGKWKLLFMSMLALTTVETARAQHFLSTSGTEILNELGEPVLLRGIGLGGWMVQEGYMLQTSGFANPQHEIRATIQELIGEEATDEFYAAWLQNHARKSDIDSLKAWGFNSVRLPMHYNLYTLPIELEPVPYENTWLDIGFELTDSLVSWCAQNEMYVILDLHAAPGGQGYDAGISDYDSSKPSLWESIQNRQKMAALWKRIAEHYVGEQWVAGYDLLNEPNWNLPGGNALRNLYMQCTDSIRSVDPDHILFIEGNWFANDFTGLTPPWDDQIVYSPHKYWSHNDQGSMNFATSIRDSYDVPLYLGESGENSNVWFRDAIRLLEDEGIGWAWWPLKKIESISAPMSIVKTDDYQYLLDYWSGSAPAPTQEFAINALMEIAEGLKAENCMIQENVVDAMFRQVYSDETRPFTNPHPIPGVIHATDFDLGTVGNAYYDNQVANYHVSTGNYTSWNDGWQYRNDGVDIQFCDDAVNSNGFNVGWISSGEWMNYTVDVEIGGLYNVEFRVAADGANGVFHLQLDGIPITQGISVPSTGGWEDWGSVVVEGVLLTEGEQTLRFYTDQSGFNLNSFDFAFTGILSNEVDMDYLTGKTRGPNQIALTLNKPIVQPLMESPSVFTLYADGESIPFSAMAMDSVNNRTIVFDLDESLNATQVLKASYAGNAITSNDGSFLVAFEMEDVINDLDYRHPLPGWVEAEAFVSQSGVELENSSDVGGGQNVGYLDPGDYLEYDVLVEHTGEYTVNFRTASDYGDGAMELRLFRPSGVSTYLCEAQFQPTGGWQSWATTSETVNMDAGIYRLRVDITSAPFNFNWMEFKFEGDEEEGGGGSEEEVFDHPFQTVITYPNPCSTEATIAFGLYFLQDLTLSIYDSRGRPIYAQLFEDVSSFEHTINVDAWAAGLYHVFVLREDGTVDSGKLIKIKE